MHCRIYGFKLDQNIRNENDMEGAKNPSGAPSYKR